jgi:hypothetical protein
MTSAAKDKRVGRLSIAIVASVATCLALACQPNGAAATAKLRASEVSAALATSTSATAGSFSDADFTKHLSELRSRLPSQQFSIVVQAPFIVIGDEPAPVVKQHAEETVKWAVDRLKQDFFPKDPENILDIWLFKDAASYERHTWLLFNEHPTTPYGYYSSKHKSLIMNIATGGGTLVHEIVHPFMEANFPACPPWLNEGLGSLYEQCGEEDGHIHGFVNWRLPGLQQAIKAKKVSSFKKLTAMDSGAFYNDDRGVNYSQSRYLCYYLQQRGLLFKFYQRFHTNQKDDPSGFTTLQQTLEEPDMEKFRAKWEKYVLNLSQDFSLRLAN